MFGTGEHLSTEGWDPECAALCQAINLIEGIETCESCCGHGKSPYRIWFYARCLCRLPYVACWFQYGWRVTVQTDDDLSPAWFMIEGPAGAYDEADEIAGLIREVIQGDEDVQT